MITHEDMMGIVATEAAEKPVLPAASGSASKIDSEIQRLETEVQRQENGKYMHFTSNNIALLLNRIAELRRQRKPDSVDTCPVDPCATVSA